MLFNRNLPTRCQKTSLRAFISWIAGIDNILLFSRDYAFNDMVCSWHNGPSTDRTDLSFPIEVHGKKT